MRWHSSPIVVTTLLIVVLAALAAAALVLFGDADLPAVRLSGACCGAALQPLQQLLPASA